MLDFYELQAFPKMSSWATKSDFFHLWSHGNCCVVLVYYTSNRLLHQQIGTVYKYRSQANFRQSVTRDRMSATILSRNEYTTFLSHSFELWWIRARRMAIACTAAKHWWCDIGSIEVDVPCRRLASWWTRCWCSRSRSHRKTELVDWWLRTRGKDFDSVANLIDMTTMDPVSTLDVEHTCAHWRCNSTRNPFYSTIHAIVANEDMISIWELGRTNWFRQLLLLLDVR